jgi:hypothetical protein
MGLATAYIVGLVDGPIKIGVTSRLPKTRISAARVESGRSDVRILGSFYHPEAYLIEKFSHIHLRKDHLYREWFAVRLEQALSAVETVIDLLAVPRVEIKPRGNYFERVGISEKAVKSYFGMDSNAVISEWLRVYQTDIAVRSDARKKREAEAKLALAAIDLARYRERQRRGKWEADLQKELNNTPMRALARRQKEGARA